MIVYASDSELGCRTADMGNYSCQSTNHQQPHTEQRKHAEKQAAMHLHRLELIHYSVVICGDKRSEERLKEVA